jgi:hypothetical protein
MTSYNYAANVRTPGAIGMSPDGTLTALGNDITGLISYTQLLVEGTGKASATGQPMGNKFFLKTMGTCQDIDTGDTVDRYIYINNIPMGNIPFISESIGGNFSSFRGLIPGMFSDMEVFNPVTIAKGFMAGSMPSCRAINMGTVDVNNNVGSETQFVADVDIEAIDPCLFSNKKNPITNAGCIEVFSNRDTSSPYSSKNNDNNIVIIFLLFAIYLIVNYLTKIKK